VNPKVRLYAAWALLVATLIGWPLSALTFAKGEPQFILGLSWLAITLTCLDIISTQDVRKQQEEGESGDGPDA
jgi:hypothetical protein